MIGATMTTTLERNVSRSLRKVEALSQAAWEGDLRVAEARMRLPDGTDVDGVAVWSCAELGDALIIGACNALLRGRFEYTQTSSLVLFVSPGHEDSVGLMRGLGEHLSAVEGHSV